MGRFLTWVAGLVAVLGVGLWAMYLWLNPTPPDWRTPYEAAKAAGDCERQVDLVTRIYVAGDPEAERLIGELVSTKRCGDMPIWDMQEADFYEEGAVYQEQWMAEQPFWGFFVLDRLASAAGNAQTSDTWAQSWFHIRHAWYDIACTWRFNRHGHIDPAQVEQALWQHGEPLGRFMAARETCRKIGFGLAQESYLETTLPRDLALVDSFVSAELARSYPPSEFLRAQLILLHQYRDPSWEAVAYDQYSGQSSLYSATIGDYLPAQLMLAEAYDKDLIKALSYYKDAQKNGADVDDKVRRLDQLTSGPDI